jgi:hypothetical protein
MARMTEGYQIFVLLRVAAVPASCRIYHRAPIRAMRWANSPSGFGGICLNWINLIPPVQPPLQKYFRFHRTQIIGMSFAVPAHTQRAFRDRHGRRAGVAVDAEARSANSLRGRTALTRTVKSCGPDAPTLASSWRKYPPMMVANKPGHQGEREGNR